MFIIFLEEIFIGLILCSNINEKDITDIKNNI